MRISDWSSDVCSSALNPEIDGRSATLLALLFHELATNAAKYGALSLPDGRVKMEVKDEDGQIRTAWREEGGTSTTPPTGKGWGNRPLQLSTDRQLGGCLNQACRHKGPHPRHWTPSPSHYQ